MNIGDAFKLAFSNLLHRRLRSWLTLLGIFAGIAAIVALISLGQGLQGAVNSQFGSLGVNTLSIQGAGSSFGPPGSNAVGVIDDNDIRLIEDIPGVEMAIGRYIQATTIESRDEIGTGFIASLPRGEKGAKLVELMNNKAEEGRIISGQDTTSITVGPSVKIDDEELEVGEKILINQETFRVAGVLKKTGNPISDNLILMSEDSVKSLFDLDGDYSIIMASIEDTADIDEVKEEIERKMRRDRGLAVGEEDFDISSPQDTIEALNDILIVVQILLVGVAGISLIVGAIGIANTMYTAVLERRREIGVMKSIGATNNNILKIFLFESGLLGLAGGVIGLALGIAISKTVELVMFYSFGENLLKASIPGWLIFGSLAVAFIIGAASGTLPARQAAKLDPVESLRG